jgi:GTPase SAR1 family protein
MASAGSGATSGEPARRVKVVLLGDSSVGKSAVVRRLVGVARGDAESGTGSGLFRATYEETLGVDVSAFEHLGARGEASQVELWCCSGAPRYLPCVQQNALAGADLFVLVYDVTSVASLQRCVFWRNEALRATDGALRAVLVGAKADLIEQARVSDESGAKQADAWGVPHLRVSCKDGAGFAVLRRMLVDLC